MDSAEWNRRYAERPLVWTAEPNRFVAEELADLAPGRALELAAGEGRNALWLAEKGWRVTAVDFSSVALDKARQLAENRGVKLDCVEADVLAYQPESAAYDLVLLAYLQLPQDEMAGVLHRAVAALAPGGAFLLVAHDLRNLTEGVGGPQDPTVLYTPEIIAAELTGLRITTAKTVRRDVSTDTGQRRAVDTLVRAVRPA